MDKIYRYIIENVTSGRIDQETGAAMLKMVKNEITRANDDIAIIGIAAKLPFANNIDEYWNNIINKLDCIGKLPQVRTKDLENYYRYSKTEPLEMIKFSEKGYLRDIDQFDYRLFKLSPKEAALMDPYQRVFLETVWQAIEDAGYGGNCLTKTNTGVFVGYASNSKDSYIRMIENVDPDLVSTGFVGNITAMLPTRISYLLDLKGPTMVYDTACSTALVGIHFACQAIKNGDCDLAIAGSVKLHLLPLDKDCYKIGIESSDGVTRSFDGGSDGSGEGEGVLAVLLKPVSKAKKDRDHIYGIIKGSAVNQDGASIGITAPNPDAQTAVILKAWENAGLNPETLSYIEAHGTATRLGDPLEIEGLTRAFRKYTDKNQICPIGTVKTNIGHTYESSGLAGLLKTVQILNHREIPPSIHFNIPNPKIDFGESPVYLNTRLRKWHSAGNPMRCAISGFGVSGTNCHMVLEEAPVVPARESSTGIQIFTLSARSETALRNTVSNYGQFLQKQKSNSNLEDLCFTANTGRGHFEFRLVMTVRNWEDFAAKIDTLINSSALGKLNEQVGYYGTHKVIPGSKEEKGPSEITESEKINLNQQVRKLIEEFDATGRCNAEILNNIGRLYIAGADIDWGLFYKDVKAYRISIPGYAFERNRCWLEVPETEATVNPLEGHLYYDLRWIKAELPQERQPEDNGAVLIFKDTKGLAVSISESFKAAGRKVFEAELGREFQKTAAGEFIIDGSEADYGRLFTEINEPVSQVIHLMTITSDAVPTDPDTLQQSQDRGAYSIFYLTRAILNKSGQGAMRFFLITEFANEVTGAESRIKPENAPLVGFGKTIGQEYPNISCRAIDIDELTSIETIIAEMNAVSKTYLSSYRDGQRYEEQMTEITVDHGAQPPIKIKEQGVYLITGGTGGIGIEISKYLASQNKVIIASITRTALPTREQWDEIVNANTDPKLTAKIKAIREIEAAGSEIVSYAANVTNLDEMNAIVTELRQRYGAIHGVIHSAGVAGAGYIIRKDESIFDRVFCPKVQGTWILNEVTKNDHLDFFVLCSSVATLAGEAGQCDYVSGNSYLDSFTAYRNKAGKRTLTINWVAWKEAGMSVEYGINVDGVFKAIPNCQAIQGFAAAIDSDVKKLVIGELNVTPQVLALLGILPLNLSDKLSALKDTVNLQADSVISSDGHEMAIVDNGRIVFLPKGKKQMVRKESAASQVKLDGRENQDYSKTEQEIAKIYSEVLGFTEISIHDNFFELGGDSILITRVHRLLEQKYPGKVKIADLFAYTSVIKLAQFIVSQEQGEFETIENESNLIIDEDIAIIGISARLPNADNIQEYWHNIKHGIDCVKGLPASRKKDLDDYFRFKGVAETGQKYIEGGYLEDIDRFDYRFFRLSPKEASLMDPYQRMFLQTAWLAIEDAGYGGKKLMGSRTGVYVAYASNAKDSYQIMISDVEPSSLGASLVGNITALMPTRISYLLDLKGPSMVINTACSASLVSIHLASQAIKLGECDAALVAGVRMNLIPFDQECFKVGIEASDGRTRAFDDTGDGAGMGEGIVAMLLKPLKKAQNDHDHIYAVIKGSALNQDGASMGITAPNPKAQEEVIIKAWKNARIHPETLSYIEAHGTGTKLGDPIEIDALRNAFQRYTAKKHFCSISSVKTNLGHLYESAGIVGLLNAALALKYKMIPPTIHFNKPNSEIDFSDSPVYINTRLKKWEARDTPRRCGVSAFGLSGTNCHMVLEEAPPLQKTDSKAGGLQVLALSAKSPEALNRLVRDYLTWFNQDTTTGLEDICYTANTGRGHYNYRLALIVKDRDDCHAKLARLEQQALSSVVMDSVFYGQHKIITSKTALDPGEITEAIKNELSMEVAVKLAEFMSTGNESELLLKEICEFYIKGAEIDWEVLYAKCAVNKVSLPVYRFERERCWINIPEVSTSQASEIDETLHYRINWKLADAQVNDLKMEGNKPKPGPILVFTIEKGIGPKLVTALRQNGQEVVEVTIGQEFCSIEPGKYTLSGTEEDYHRLFENIDVHSLSQIVQITAVNSKGAMDSLGKLTENQNRGFFSLFHLTKILAQSGIQPGLELIILADYVNEITGDEPRINPGNAILFGFARVMTREMPDLTWRSVDLDEHVSVDILRNELAFARGSGQIAYRNGRRYEEEFAKIDLDNLAIKEITLTTDGVYLITGGTGGIGLAIAHYLSENHKVKLALINRTPMPPKETWEQILTREADTKLARQISQIKTIESSGSEVEFFSADIADMKEMKKLLDSLRLKYGKINGIIHGAGVRRDELIINENEVEARQTLVPKVQGTWVLDRLTQDDPLDFMVVFSSIATVFGAPGQGVYAAANAFLDSFAAYRNRTGKKTLCINWTTWKETGMAAESGHTYDTAFKAMPTVMAIKGFDLILNKAENRVIIGVINYEGSMAAVLEKSSLRLAPAILKKIQKSREHLQTRIRTTGKSGAVKLIGRENGEYSSIEKTIADIWGDELGFGEISIYDNFFELGGDSISGMRIMLKINQQLQKQITMIDFLSNVTIIDLAKNLNQLMGNSDLPELERVAGEDSYPMSSAQKRFFYINQLEPESLNYNVTSAALLEGALDPQKVEATLRQIIKRHETLRTSFGLAGEEPVQKVHPEIDFKVDLYECNEAEVAGLIKNYIRPFDLSKIPLFRVALFKLAEDKFIIMYDMYHIITDGVSMDVLNREFVDLYCGKQLPELKFQYRDFSAWQNKLAGSEYMKKQAEYWRRSLEGSLPVLNLPTDYPRPPVQSYEGKKIVFEIDAELTGKLNLLASGTGSTLYMVMLAAFNVFLYKCTAQEDIIIGTVVTGRTHLDLYNIIGTFVNMAPMRNYPQGSKCFNDFLDEVKQNTLKAFENQDYPYDDLVNSLGLERDVSRNPLFDVLLVFQNVGHQVSEFPHFKVSPYFIDNNISRFDLSLEVVETGSKMQLLLEYSTRLFKPETIEMMGRDLQNILSIIVRNVHIKIEEIELEGDKNLVTDNQGLKEIEFEF